MRLKLLKVFDSNEQKCLEQIIKKEIKKKFIEENKIRKL